MSSIRINRVVFTAIAGVAMILVGAQARAGSGTGSLSGETFIHSRFPGNNNGGCPYVTIGYDGAAGQIRGLIEFNLPQPVPGYAGRTTVTGVILQNLVVTNLPNGTAGTAETYFAERLSGSFLQGNGCGAQASTTYNAGVACGSVSFGATWNASNCVTGWTAGAPVSGGAMANTFGGPLGWDSGGNGTNCSNLPQLCADVQAFLDGGVVTGGWRIRNTELTAGHAQALTHSGTLAFNWSCKAGFFDTGSTCTTCTAAAKTACVVTCPSTGGACTSGQPSGNSCNDAGPPSTTYTCTCNNPAYTGTGTTACTDFNACVGNPCASSGDTSATCIDAVAPATGYSCSCNTGFTYNGATCVSQCHAGSNPCNVNGDNGSSCTVVGSGGWTCACSTGYASTGGTTPACANFNACTAGGGNAACVITCPSTGGTCTSGQPSGNVCNDLPPPSTSFTCTCPNAAYTVSGATCADKNECSPNPCTANGDAAATCTDAVAPNTGHTCTCTAGFIASNQGTSSAGCVDACSAATSGTASDPCGGGKGTCTVSGATWTCACNAGYVSTGGSQPTCVDFNACTAGGGNAACIITCPSTGGTCTAGQPSGNVCNDLPPPSTSYTCTCSNAAYAGTGTTMCTDANGCSPNQCGTGGDTGALVACHDAVAPAIGHTCTCDTGFNFNGTTCQSQCGGGSNPCDTNGETTATCTVVGTGGWTCGCTAGFVSTGGVLPTCTNFNACNAAAQGDCNTGFSGNACIDELPPSVTYHCSCGNAAYTTGTGSDGGPGCVHINFCAPNHCADGGDTAASCTNSTGAATGYSCTCSSSTLWALGTVAGFATCVDVNECASGNPCLNGVCTNVPAGGGYTCACNTGYFPTTNTKTPQCLHPTMCDGPSNLACVTSLQGNTCTIKPAPSLDHTCTCDHAGYIASADDRSCIVEDNPCKVNHCIDHGDPLGTCVASTTTPATFSCTCSPGWHFDGSTCVDTDECLSGGNPCNRGTCENLIGSYACACEPGFHSDNAPSPTCVPDITPNGLHVTSNAGGCGCTIAAAQPQRALVLLCCAALLLALARRRAWSRRRR